MISMAAKIASAKSKQFKWTSEMIGDLSTCLKASKQRWNSTELISKGIGLHVNRP